MRNVRAPIAVAVAVAILAVGSAQGCGTDPYEPRPGPGPGDGRGPAVLTRLDVTPATADLCAQGNSVQLTLVPRDQNGMQIWTGAGTATYSSSAPDSAGVSASGVVTAAAPGTAGITATFTYGGKTQLASMNATVHEEPAEYPALAGVYDLATVHTISTWGMEGTLATAVVTIEQPRGTPLFAGSFADFSMFVVPNAGSVSGSVDCVGGVVLELRAAGEENIFWRGKGTLTSGRIVGD